MTCVAEELSIRGRLAGSHFYGWQHPSNGWLRMQVLSNVWLSIQVPSNNDWLFIQAFFSDLIRLQFGPQLSVTIVLMAAARADFAEGNDFFVL